MSETAQFGVFVGALFGAGVAVGALRQRSSKPAWKMLGKAVLCLLALAVVLFFLAALFNSATLGWVVGLSLMGLLALWPGVAVFALGQWVGGKFESPGINKPQS